MASPQDLTTLAAVKAWQNVTTMNDDVELALTITAVSRVLLNVMSRSSVYPTIYNTPLDGSGNSRIILREWPVTSINLLTIDGQTVGPASAAGQAWTDGYRLEPWDGNPPGQQQALDLYGWSWCRGRQNILVNYTAGYQITGEAHVVAAAQATASAPFGPWWSDLGVSYASGAPLIKVISAPAVGQYKLDAVAGVYDFNSGDNGESILIGYAFTPQDLEQVCRGEVWRFFKRKARIDLRSETLGGQQTSTYDLSALTDLSKLVLQSYKRMMAC